jgi:hypothetical protein
MFRFDKSLVWTAALSLAAPAISGCSMQSSATGGGNADLARPASYRQRTSPQQEFEAERDHIMSTGRAPIALPVENAEA